MRSRHFWMLLPATIIFFSDAAIACTFHNPSSCGFGQLSSDGPSRISELMGMGSLNDEDWRPTVQVSHEGLFRHLGGEQAPKTFSSNDHGLGSGGHGLFANQTASSLWNPVGLGEKDQDAVKFAVNGPILLQFLDGRNPATIVSSASSSDSRATPLPATWSMMVIGLALLGAFARYRKLEVTAVP
jgi:hypothetical protein